MSSVASLGPALAAPVAGAGTALPQEPTRQGAAHSVEANRSVNAFDARNLDSPTRDELHRLAARASDPSRRAQSLVTLAHARDGRAESLAAAAVDPDQPLVVRQAGAQALGFLAASGSAGAMSAVLDHTSEEAGLAAALRSTGAPQAMAIAWLDALAHSSHRLAAPRLARLREATLQEPELAQLVEAAERRLDRVREVGPTLATLSEFVGYGDRTRVRELVLVHHFHGLPYEGTRVLGLEALPVLEEILFDPTLSEFWTNAVGALGLIAEPECTPILLAFVARSRGEVDVRHFRSLTEVPRALAHVARNGDALAERVLLELSEGRYPLDAFSHGRHSGDQLVAGFVDLAINGLGVASTSTTRAALDRLHAANEIPSLEDDFEYALEIHATVVARGAFFLFDR